MFDKIPEMIGKVRERFGDNPRYKALLSLSAKVYGSENEETGKIELDRIVFEYYDKIEILEDRVVYVPEHGYSTVLLCYTTWEDILRMR